MTTSSILRDETRDRQLLLRFSGRGATTAIGVRGPPRSQVPREWPAEVARAALIVAVILGGLLL